MSGRRAGGAVPAMTFFEVTDYQDPRMHELLVLNTFEHSVEAGVVSTGLVITSRAVFAKVLKTHDNQGDSAVCATDGTYKLHFGEWVLVDCGTVAAGYERGGFVRQFRPWAYLFVRSECAFAYTSLFSTIQQCAENFNRIDLQLAWTTINHTSAIALTLRTVWPRINVVTCWPHLIRQARKQRSLLRDPKRFEDILLPDIRLLRSSRSHRQLETLSEVVLRGWYRLGEAAYADWFRKVYLSTSWDRWHVNIFDEPGVVADQQPTESHQAVIKKAVANGTHATTSHVLTTLLPRLLVADGTRNWSQHCRHFTSGK